MMTASLTDDPVGAFLPGPRAYLAGATSGRLAGLRFAVKDVFDVPGRVTGFGQPTWRATHAPAIGLASAVRLPLDAGATLVGTTVCDELCYSLTGENAHDGAPVNPRAPGRVAGGSSSGSAAAVAAGLVDFALGTDCGGSVRVPASYCGLLGIRPSHGRVVTDGVLPFAPPFDVVGWFARDAATFTRVGAVMLGGAVPTSALPRLVLPDDVWAALDAPVADAVAPLLSGLVDLAACVERVELAPEGLSAWAESFRVLQAASVWQTLGSWVKEHRPRFGPGVADRFAAAAEVDPDQVGRATAVRDRVRARLGDVLGDDGVLCLPTVPHAAPRRAAPVDEVELTARGRALRLLCIAGLAGLPQVSVPGPRLAGNPVGLSLIGPAGSDLTLIAHAVAMTTAVAAPATARTQE